MPLRIRRTRAADQDLYDIWAYIRPHNRGAADALILRLNQLFAGLSINPELGRARMDLGPGLRMFPHERYGIYYRFNEDTLTIVRVLSSFRDSSGQSFLNE